MRRSDQFFTVTICPKFYVTPCAESLAWEAKGCFGFHQFTTCANCVITADGFEAWGCNGHMQGHIRDRAHLLHWLKRMALKQWTMQAGGLMGYRFEKGSAIHYRAN